MSIVVINSSQKWVAALKPAIVFRAYNVTGARGVAGVISHACGLRLRIRIISEGYRETINSGIFANSS